MKFIPVPQLAATLMALAGAANGQTLVPQDKPVTQNPAKIVLRVSGMAKSVAFYRDKLGLPFLADLGWLKQPASLETALGLPAECRGSAQHLVVLGYRETPGATIELQQWRFPRTCRLQKFTSRFIPDMGYMAGWNVADVDAVYAELKARGVQFQAPPQALVAFGKSYRVTFARDPDGTVLEFVQLPSQ